RRIPPLEKEDSRGAINACASWRVVQAQNSQQLFCLPRERTGMGVALELLRISISRSSISTLLASSKRKLRGCPVVTWSDARPRLGIIRTFAAAKPEGVLVPRKKRRLDEVCLERFQQYSRTFIQSWILQGKVLVDGKVVNKAGTLVSDKSTVEIRAEVPKYVCRAGYKLEAAIEQLNVDVSGKVALDSGLSTGGFTDCLLQHGASFVYGVDVGYGQVLGEGAEICLGHLDVPRFAISDLSFVSEGSKRRDIGEISVKSREIRSRDPEKIHI
ncbi:hypothetical protein Taro_023416, partial [Colocasia esculenta]|nr:hypothetical protein [Colocasia esculenta]